MILFKPTFDYLKEVLAMKKFEGEQQEATRKIINELQAANIEVTTVIVQQ